MNDIDKIKTELINWASNKNIEIDNDAYVKNMDDNFIVKLSDESLRDLVDCFEDRFLNPDTL